MSGGYVLDTRCRCFKFQPYNIWEVRWNLLKRDLSQTAQGKNGNQVKNFLSAQGISRVIVG